MVPLGAGRGRGRPRRVSGPVGGKRDLGFGKDTQEVLSGGAVAGGRAWSPGKGLSRKGCGGRLETGRGVGPRDPGTRGEEPNKPQSGRREPTELKVSGEVASCPRPCPS